MPEIDRRLAATLAAQQGLVTRRQVLAAGGSDEGAESEDARQERDGEATEDGNRQVITEELRHGREPY